MTILMTVLMELIHLILISSYVSFIFICILLLPCSCYQCLLSYSPCTPSFSFSFSVAVFFFFFFLCVCGFSPVVLKSHWNKLLRRYHVVQEWQVFSLVHQARGACHKSLQKALLRNERKKERKERRERREKERANERTRAEVRE